MISPSSISDLEKNHAASARKIRSRHSFLLYFLILLPFAFRGKRKHVERKRFFQGAKRPPNAIASKSAQKKGQGINWNIESSETYRIYTAEMVASFYVAGVVTRENRSNDYICLSRLAVKRFFERKRVFQGAKRPPKTPQQNNT